MLQFKKISTKFISLAVFALTVAIFLTGGISYCTARSSIITKLKSSDLIQIASLKASKVDSRITRAIETSNLIANDPTIINWFLGEETNVLLGELVKKKLNNTIINSDYTNVFAANKKTLKYWKSNNNFSTFLDSANPINDWFFKALNDGKKTQININSDSKNDIDTLITKILTTIPTP